tara:strand:- start:78683 stop:80584 length:1902 start_codon:yes stop_codon:yes gene_type:complete
MATTFAARSGHIVGAHMAYQCLNPISNSYRINLTVYRDCFSLSFDIALNVAIYDSLNNLVQDLPMQRGTPYTIPKELTTHPCAVAPPSVCLQSVVYSAIVHLPPIPGGYTASWQRCCRGSAIQNISGSGNYGLTATVQIPRMDTIGNSSAHVASTLTNILCIGEPLNYKFDIEDSDGDSLVYNLCDLYAGGGGTAGNFGCTTTASIPSPACPPPYVLIPFAGTYTAQNPMPASIPISLDPQTGVLTGLPDQQGSFALGICVDEYRDGILINTLRIDYLYYVVSCLYAEADMLTPTEDTSMLCNGLSVDFTSESLNGTSLFWNFGDSTTLADTALGTNPTYTFPSPGNYTLTHIAKGKVYDCNDTMVLNITVREEVLPDFDWFGNTCFEKHEIEFFSKGFYPNDVKFRWVFGTNASVDTFYHKEPPKIKWDSPGNYIVTLRVDYGTCYNEYSETINIEDFSIGAGIVGSDFKAGIGEEILLQGFGGNEYYWFADKPVQLASRLTKNTSAIMPLEEDTITFYLRVKNTDGCEKLDSIKVYISGNSFDAAINFFTPNNDGLNDVFDLQGLNPGGCEISIMNRWGKLVWEVKNYENNWEGKNMGGDELPDGTYYYILECDGIIIHKSAVTLMRKTGI